MTRKEFGRCRVRQAQVLTVASSHNPRRYISGEDVGVAKPKTEVGGDSCARQLTDMVSRTITVPEKCSVWDVGIEPAPRDVDVSTS